MNKEFLPQGDNIRQLLVKSNITNVKINSLLREKGVYLGRNQKDDSIPILMKTIISPNDYENLYSLQKIKEDVFKYRAVSIKCKKDFKLQDVFVDNIDVNSLIKDKYTFKPDFVVLGNPNFYFDKIGAVDNAVFEYKIQRENLLNDWTNNITFHDGSVIVKKSNEGEIQINIQQSATSKETIEVNNIIINTIKKMLCKNQLIGENDDFISILFNSFNNVARIKFLYAFMANFCIYLTFESILDIDLNLDERVESHKDVKLFLDKIENLKIKGKGLQNHILVYKEVYFPKLIFAFVEFKYKLNYHGVEGFVYLKLSFPEYIKSKSLSSEFQISMDFEINKESKKRANEDQIRKELLVFIERKKIDSFDKFSNLF